MVRSAESLFRSAEYTVKKRRYICTCRSIVTAMTQTDKDQDEANSPILTKFPAPMQLHQWGHMLHCVCVLGGGQSQRPYLFPYLKAVVDLANSSPWDQTHRSKPPAPSPTPRTAPAIPSATLCYILEPSECRGGQVGQTLLAFLLPPQLHQHSTGGHLPLFHNNIRTSLSQGYIAAASSQGPWLGLNCKCTDARV